MARWKWLLTACVPLVTATCLLWARLQVSQVSTQAANVPVSGTPKIEIDHETHDFGVMDVGERGRHTFTVRNVGTADLRLQSGGTSCKCTLLNSPNGMLKPGEHKTVEIEWQAPEPKENFHQGGVLFTNDPDRKMVTFNLVGSIRAKFATSPMGVVFGDVRTTETREQRVIVYSQIWDRFKIVEVECPLPQLQYKFVPARPEQLVPLGATAGYEMILSLAAGLDRGEHNGKLSFTIDVPTEPAVQFQPPRELAYHVDVVSDFSLHGRHVVGTCLQMGNVKRGLAGKERLYLLARGAAADVEIQAIKASSGVVKITWQRDESFRGKVSRFILDVEIPADTPAFDHRGPKCIEVEVVTNHPTTPVVHFQIDATVY